MSDLYSEIDEITHPGTPETPERYKTPSPRKEPPAPPVTPVKRTRRKQEHPRMITNLKRYRITFETPRVSTKTIQGFCQNICTGAMSIQVKCLEDKDDTLDKQMLGVFYKGKICKK